ncbi:hypothetical protein 7F15_51 [uncultured Caudovirales phage]|uniref:Uncharacterized protein n=1 Tax=uncultured Caudovirales phage TaxID=2100421 RepID=A0A2H4J2U3_9CAUD|nr:hypothetical protein 7F15_51 [uncultured Caudovirales phage]
MKIRDLDLDQYVIVYDMGKSENNKGMTVVGRVDEIIFNEDDKNEAGIDSLGNFYHFDDNNYFDLWSNYIESKTESVSIKNKETEEIVSSGEVEATIDLSNSEFAHLRQSNDLQQRKRNKKIVQWSDDTKLKFIERAIQDLSPLAAYHIGNAIDVLAVAESKEDIEQARWSLERAFENWDVK